MYADDIAGRMALAPAVPAPAQPDASPPAVRAGFLQGVAQYMGQKIRTVQWNPRFLSKANGESGEPRVNKYTEDDRSSQPYRNIAARCALWFQLSLEHSAMIQGLFCRFLFTLCSLLSARLYS